MAMPLQRPRGARPLVRGVLDGLDGLAVPEAPVALAALAAREAPSGGAISSSGRRSASTAWRHAIAAAASTSTAPKA
jgi:hypothetical protein